MRAWSQNGLKLTLDSRSIRKQVAHSPRFRSLVTMPWMDASYVYIAQGISWEWNVKASLSGSSRAAYVEGAHLIAAYERDPQEALALLGPGRVIFLYPFLNYDRVLDWLRENFFIFMITWDDSFGFYARSHVRRLRYADCALSQMPGNACKYRSIGVPWLWMPEGGHANAQCAVAPREFRAAYVGNRFGRRGRLIARLEESLGDTFHAYGPGSRRGMIDSEAAQQVQREASVSIACSDLAFGFGLTHLKCRHFEIPCSGGLMLAEWTPELARVYDCEREILTFQNFKDCLEKIEWVRTHPQEADKIRRAGHARAVRDHTWRNRFETILAELHEAAAF